LYSKANGEAGTIVEAWRHDCMTKSRTSSYIAIGLSILLLAGLLWSVFSTQSQEPAQVLPAVINRDCAPWDGMAFTVTIPYAPVSTIDISIWQAPDISLPVTFRFPDSSGRVGNAVYRPGFGEPEQITGTAFFRRVGEGGPVEGEFNFERENGVRLRGKFKAEWGNQRALCG
jgi:hypothetical protein